METARTVRFMMLAISLASSACAQPVQLTADLPWFDLSIGGETYRIQRNPDNGAALDGAFARTSRACPPFCIQPMQAAPGVATLAEIEVLRFLNEKVRTGSGLLVDARIAQWHAQDAIPGAVNLPFTLTEGDVLPDVLEALGARRSGTGWDFTGALPLVLHCNGAWSDQAPRAIRALMAAGYPAERLSYYRGGMQGWLGLGLTTLSPGTDTTAQSADARPTLAITGLAGDEARAADLRARIEALVASAATPADPYVQALIREAGRDAPVDVAQEPTQAEATTAAATTAATETAPVEPVFVTVGRGDTLSTLAQRFYGDRLQFRRIWAANRTLIRNPDILPLGLRLRIPQ